MRLYLQGHDYKYAVEQSMLTLFPGQKPEYPAGRPEGERMEVRLHRAAQFTTVSCRIRWDGQTGQGMARLRNAPAEDTLAVDRVCQRLLRTAIYRAALNAGVRKPVWGALTGVRPGKLLAEKLRRGQTPAEALRAFREDYDVSGERAELCLQTTMETLAAERSLEERDICLYVGIPFCPTRCAYCSFVSQSVEKSMKLIEPFLQALYQEMDAVGRQVKEQRLRVVSVYFGGGTPTTPTAEQLEELCSRLEQAFDLSALREYTVEAGRPDTITEEKLRVLKKHGVDRVSVNPQTMMDPVLECIGRHHTAEDIVQALEKVRRVGGFAVNMDLIAGLPADSPAGFSQTLDRVLALQPENITVHTLSLKKGSRITLESTRIPDAGEVGEMLDEASRRLSGAGYAPYYLYRQKFMSGGFENVGWTKPGFTNLYNICIMEELCSILAMGGGGSTKLIRPGDGRNLRLMAPKYPLEYIQNIEKTCADKAQIGSFYGKEQK